MIKHSCSNRTHRTTSITAMEEALRLVREGAEDERQKQLRRVDAAVCLLAVISVACFGCAVAMLWNVWNLLH